MAYDRTLTSANSVFTIQFNLRDAFNSVTGLQVPDFGVFNSVINKPIKLEGWEQNRFFDAPAIQKNLTVMSPDGTMFTGKVFNPVQINISLYPASPSNKWLRYASIMEDTLRESFLITGTLIIPSVKEAYSFDNGVMNTATPVPGHGQILSANSYNFTFQRAYPMDEVFTSAS